MFQSDAQVTPLQIDFCPCASEYPMNAVVSATPKNFEILNAGRA
jgi:hypothetical protein